METSNLEKEKSKIPPPTLEKGGRWIGLGEAVRGRGRAFYGPTVFISCVLKWPELNFKIGPSKYYGPNW